MQDNIVKSDEELEQIIAKGSKKTKIAFALFALGAIVGVPMFFLQILPLAIAALVPIIIGIIIKSSADEETKFALASSVIPQVLNRVFDDVDYQPGLGISENIIRNVDMNFKFRYDKVFGEDLVQAKYKGLNIQMSDVKIITVETVHTKNGVQHRDVTNFKGTWLICDFGKELSADLVLSEKEGLSTLFKGGGVKTDSESFNKQFHIKTDNDHDAFYILTPHMMEYIQQMDAQANGSTHMHFMRGGKIHIAINSNRDMFKLKILSNEQLDELKDKFEQDIRYITNLLDELRLCDTIYKH